MLNLENFIKKLKEQDSRPSKKQLEYINLIFKILDIDIPIVNTDSEAQDWISEHIDEYNDSVQRYIWYSEAIDPN